MSSRQSTELPQTRPPRLQTSLQRRPSTAPHSGTPTSNGLNRSQTQQNGTPDTANLDSPQAAPGHQGFVLTDPIAFRYLEDDPATTVLERRRELQGYECYIVEQWTTSRSHPTFTITTYTGDPTHTVVVGVLSVPTDESTWSPRLRVYFKALNQYHAKRRETPLGILMVTNLSNFPSSLTVIPVPDGDLRQHRSDFFVNENLKRLNCSGRVGLTLVAPAGATVAKFHQLYRTSDKNEIYHSVIELVKLCQSALMLFDKLEIDYADGLLCDVTERAVSDWWMDMGSEYYHIEPHDGILGPTTVAGLLGLLMGARNRLHSVNAPVAKDPFDVESMKKGISTFQKQQRLPRSRRLDRRTLERLHRATQKAANSDGYWAVPKAVKSTVAELSGKGGEMVMDVVGRRDRAGIAEIETCDIERFVQLVYGERAKWLWLGRPLKHKAVRDVVGLPLRVGEEREELEGKMLKFREDEHGGFTWTARKSVADGLKDSGTGKKEAVEDPGGTGDQSGDEADEGEGIKGVLKRTSGFKEARSGFGKFKGAVGLGGHHKSPKDKDETPQTPTSPYSARQSMEENGVAANNTPNEKKRRPLMRRSQSSPGSQPNSPKTPITDYRFSSALAESIPEQATVAPAYAASYREGTTRQSRESPPPPSYRSNEKQNQSTDFLQAGTTVAGSDQASMRPPESFIGDQGSIEDSAYNEAELNEVLPNGVETDANRLLRRTVSSSQVISVNLQSQSEDAFPRHLSFSLVEDSVLTWTEVVQWNRDTYFDDAKAQLVDEEFFAEESKELRETITTLNTNTASFTQGQLQSLQTLVDKLDSDQVALDNMYQPYLDQTNALRSHAEGIFRSEKERLEEAGKEIEMLAAKLEYEINGLRGRLEDVEAGVSDFDKGVSRVEDRVSELEKDAERAEQGWSCVIC